jgi:hypothetical protein
MKFKEILNSRRFGLLAAAAAMIGGIGCATMLTASEPGSRTTTKAGAVVLKDAIQALGKPDAEMIKQIGNPGAVAFFGVTHTYLLIEGGPVLMDYAKRLDSSKVTLVPDSQSLYVRDSTVWGDLHFTYAAATGQTLSDDEKATMRALHFALMPNGSYRSVVSVKGAVYPAVDLKDKGLTQLHHSRDLVFRAPPITETTPNLGKYALLPVAIVVDVVTAPIQILGFGVFLLSARGNIH